jgi:hypothetical protein
MVYSVVAIIDLIKFSYLEYKEKSTYEVRRKDH